MSNVENDIATQVTAKIITDTLERLYAPLSRFINVQKARFVEDFQSYCSYMHDKSSLIRTLYSKNKPVPLEQVYIKTKFRSGSLHVEYDLKADSEIIESFASGNRIVVKGHGGSGKTVFLKYLWLERFKKSDGRIPIYIELRRLNDLSVLDLVTFCRGELQADRVLTDGVFEKLCEAGRFEFIFDGFDEVARGKRRSVEKQIIELSDRYKKCCFMVSGREDDRFSAWGSFEILVVAPLELSDVKLLIDKISFDAKVKKKFKETLTPQFYELHKSFLSSPLLATMMLMTFNENAAIPSRITVFYNDAFQTLLTWHDATKDSFERERYLGTDELRKVFATFCLISYYDQIYEFDEAQLRTYLKKALTYHQQTVSVDSALADICEAVNLLQKDGLRYVFIHRSFQEFFAAECAMRIVSGKAEEFLKVFARRQNDSVFEMCYEIHPELVYDKYLKAIVDEAPRFSILNVNRRKKYAILAVVVPEFSVRFRGRKRGLELTFGGVSKRPSALDEIDFVRLCSGIDGTASNTDLRFLAFNRAIHACIAPMQRRYPSSVGDVMVELTVAVFDDRFRLSARNIGENKLSPDDLKSLKEFITQRLPERFREAEKELRDRVNHFSSFCEELSRERAEKSKSIEDILGLE